MFCVKKLFAMHFNDITEVKHMEIIMHERDLDKLSHEYRIGNIYSASTGLHKIIHLSYIGKNRFGWILIML